MDRGLSDAIANMSPVEFAMPNSDRVTLQIEEAGISFPQLPMGSVGVKNHKILPTECRQRASTYKGKLSVKVSWSLNGNSKQFFMKDMGDIPIMVKVRICLFILIVDNHCVFL